MPRHRELIAPEEMKSAVDKPWSEGEARATFEQAAVGIAHIGLEGTWIRVNRRLCTFLGYSQEELWGLTFQDITHPDDLEKDLALVDQVLGGEIESYSMEKRYIRKDGSLAWANLTESLVRDDEGQPRHFISVVEDISERKALRDRLQKVNEELERRIEERTRHLEQSNRDLEQFAYVASHDLKQPLRMVTGFSQLLQRRYADALDESAREYIRYITNGTERMRVLIDALLSYSRIHAEETPFEPFELGDVIALVLADMGPSLADSGGMVCLAGRWPHVVGDAVQIRQVFQNLIDNAIKYSGSSPPRVCITTHVEGDVVTVAVRDHGPGIAEDSLQRVFEIFKRMHHQDDTPGTGIGLAAAKRILERHGQRIWAVSRTPGVEFRFELEVHRPAGE